MLEALAFLVSTGAVVAIVVGFVRPALRRPIGLGLAGLGAFAAGLALATGGTGPRSLELTHTFAAYVGQGIELKPFPIETVTAPGFAWGLVALAFCGAWGLALIRLKDFHAFWGPLALAWSGEVCAIALEKAAAPAGLVDPLTFDRAVFPAAIGAAILLANQCRKVFLCMAWLSLFVTMARIPLVLFGTLATRGAWGTSLDVHSITRFANPLTQEPLRVAESSYEQLGWLIWAPNLVVLPALYMMSAGGVAFAVTMFVMHPKEG